MDTKVTVKKNSVILEIQDLNSTAIQIIDTPTGDSETYIKLEISMKEWKKMLSNFRQNKQSLKKRVDL